MNKKLIVPSCLLRERLFLFLITLSVLASSGIYAQSTATEIETLLQTNAVTYAQAARVALDAAEKLTTADHGEAFRYAMEQGWLPRNADADSEARLDGVALLCMKAFDISGGMFYRIGNRPLHAYRELVYRRVIIGRADPAMKVSGEQLLFIVGRLLGEHERNIEREPTARERRREQERQARELRARREALAAEITTILEEQEVADTTAEATSEGIMIRLSNIQFIANSAQLLDGEIAKITEIAAILRTLPGIKIQVTGHAAAAGDREGEQRLSLERARTVANLLVSQGAVRAGDIQTQGLGSDFPIADNSTAAGMAANRRVEITILEN